MKTVDLPVRLANNEPTMITKMNHVIIYVLDQESAYEFYVNKLGFTVTPPDQPDLEISLMAIDPGMTFDEGSAKQMRDLVTKGTFGFGVFECNDLNATYEELKTKGVEFLQPPTKEFYGYEAIFKDDSGNWFSLGQKG